MFFPAYFFIITLATAGFIIAWYIYFKKQTHDTLVCPLNSKCEVVINSSFSRFFGIPIEILGMGYYALMIIGYTVFMVMPSAATPLAIFLIVIISTAAFLFSIYLTFIQAFALREWCTWCLTSATLSTLIFLAAILFSQTGFTELLIKYHEVILFVHLVGIALGVGGATITDVFFFKFLKDFRISHEENDVLRSLSQVIWFALGLLVVSGIGLYLPDASLLNQTPKFIVKVLAVAVIILNGAFLNLIVSPKLVRISFGKRHRHQDGELRQARRLAFAMGAISIVSWYSALALGFLPKSLPFSALEIIGSYLALLVLAVITSQIIGHFLSRQDPELAEP
jgi:uncharacterized membrane protein